MPSRNPDKAIRSAKMVAQRVSRAPGGSLSDAINNFSQQRNAQLTRSGSSGDAATQLALAQMYGQHPQLAVAPEGDNRRPQPMASGVNDLGAEIDQGAKWLSGAPDDDVAPAKGSPSKSGKPPALITSKSNPVENVPSSSESPSVSALASYIYRRAQDYGVNPNLALGIALREGLNNNTVAHGGNRDAGGWSYGPFQLFSGGLAPQFQKETGLDPRDPSTQYAQADWALKFMRDNPGEISNGSKTWFSIRDNGGTGNLSSIGANYAARNGNFAQSTQSADNSPTPATQTRESPQVDAQGIAKVPNSDGSFTLTDQGGRTVGYDRGAASLSSVPQSQPHMPPTQSPAAAQSPPPAPPPPPPSPPPAPAQQPQMQATGPQAQADPMSNLYDRTAFMPEVASGYDSPQVLYSPDQPQAARGGYLHRAYGGLASMPTDELIAYALERIRRRRAATGGQQQISGIGPSITGLKAALGETPLQAGTPLPQQAGAPLTPSQQTMLERNITNQEFSMPVSSAYGTTTVPDVGKMSTMLGEEEALGETGDNQSQPATPTVPGPAIPNGQVGNAAGATGSPIGGVPNAQPNGAASNSTNPNGPQWGNTLNQALGTNDPTMNQIFGFNYPAVPPPKPQPVGPVSQNEINGLYGFGGGSQMGTGTFQSGGAIRRADGGAAYVMKSHPPVDRIVNHPDLSDSQKISKLQTMALKAYPSSPVQNYTREAYRSIQNKAAPRADGGAIIMDAALNKARKAINAASGGVMAPSPTFTPKLTPAVRVDGKVYQGEGTHLNALQNVPMPQRKDAIFDASNRGFVDHRGKFRTRWDAQKYAREHGLFKDNSPSWVNTAPELTAEYVKSAMGGRIGTNGK